MKTKLNKFTYLCPALCPYRTMKTVRIACTSTWATFCRWRFPLVIQLPLFYFCDVFSFPSLTAMDLRQTLPALPLPALHLFDLSLSSVVLAPTFRYLHLLTVAKFVKMELLVNHHQKTNAKLPIRYLTGIRTNKMKNIKMCIEKFRQSCWHLARRPKKCQIRRW